MDAWIVLGVVLTISTLALLLYKPFFRDLDALDEAYFAPIFQQDDTEQEWDLIDVIRRAKTVEDLFVELEESDTP